MNRAQILTASRAEAARLAGQPLSEVTPSRRDFAQFVDTQKQDLAVIARLGAEPAWSTVQLVARARACDDADVAALAVVTGVSGRPLADLQAVVDATTAPVLRNDPIVDRSQLYDSRLRGADGAIFPTADLDADTLQGLVTVASSLHMASVVEVQSAADLATALRLPHALIGLCSVAADDRLDLARTLQLARAVPPQRTVICLAAVRSPTECASLRGACDAIVVADAISAADDVAAAIKALLGS
jgi:indole-3-glycerol phosphate synthase